MMDWDTCLRILGATSSGPLGLVQFKISSWSFTSSSVIKKSGQVFTGLIFSVGRSGSSSICEIFEKYWLKISHFFDGCTIILPPCFNGV
jgi:hypothetical protein